jgi:gas vesicle protein
MKSRSMMSFIGGALAGAAAMYILDPEMGERRRKMIASQAGDCMEGTKDILQSGWDKVSDYAGDWGHTVADKAQQYGSSLSDMAHDTASNWSSRAQDAGSSLADTAGGWLNRGGKFLRGYGRQAQSYVPSTGDIRDNLTDYSKSLWKQLRGTGQDMSDRARSQARSYLGESSPILPVTLTAIGCCAIGAGIMYIADPRLGRARRSWLMDKSRSMVNRTGKSFYRTGRHMANKAKGVVAETRGAGQDLVERINGSLRGMLKDPSSVQVSCDMSGTVTLVGRIASEQYDRVLQMVQSMPGVNSIVNRLETTPSTNTSTTTSGPQCNTTVPQL